MIDLATSDDIVETARLWLPPLTEADAGDFAALFKDDWDAIKQTGQLPYPVTKAAMEAWISQRSGPGSNSFMLRRKEDRQAIGVIGFGGRGAVSELGYVIGRTFWGQGYATEATVAMTDVARDRGFGGLQAYSFVENPASARVLEKAGFSSVGTIVREYPKRGGMRRVTHFRRML